MSNISSIPEPGGALPVAGQVAVSSITASLPAGTNVIGQVLVNPTLYYTSFTLQDSLGNLWSTIMTDQGLLQTTSTTVGPPITLFMNDSVSQTSWQVLVSTSGVLSATVVPYNPIYPTVLGFITPSGLQSLLFIDNGIFISRTPGRPSATSVTGSVNVTNLPPNAAQETGGNLALIASESAFTPQISDLLLQILSQLKYLNLQFSMNTNTDVEDPDSIATTFTQ